MEVVYKNSFSEDTTRLIDSISRGASSISDKKIKNAAKEWIKNYYDLSEVFDHTSKGYKAFISLTNSVNNARMKRTEWLKKLRIIFKEYDGRLLQKGKAGPILLQNIRQKNFDDRKFHKSIIVASRKLFIDKYYSQAIFEACKLLNKKVQTLAGSTLDGKQLMLTTFSVSAPKITLNSLQTQSDKDEQEGFMHIFAGVMHGIRNPKGHEVLNLKDQVKALEYLALISLLFRRLEESII